MEIATLEALLENIKNGESSTLEFKIAPPRPAELAERLCGFANSRVGGTLIIGVADQTWEIVGVKSENDVIDTILQAARLCKPALAIAASQIQTLKIQDKTLVLAYIPANNGKLYQAGGSYWLRRGTRTSPMDTDEIMGFLHQHGQLQWEVQPALTASIQDDIDYDKVRAYLDHLTTLTKRAPRITNYIELLLKLKCAVRVASDQAEGLKQHTADDLANMIYPTNAGLLLFGYAPRYILTQAEIIATYYQDNSGVQRYTNRKTLTGTIPEQIDMAAELLELWTPVGAHIEGFRRVDEPALPLEALREAVVNAVVHRDYSLAGTAVRIFYYPDRVEIHNPGLLPGNISIERLQQGDAPSLPRNPVIASILKDIPGGYMERVGSGIRFMINQMTTMHLPEPEFKEQDEFVVTFYKNDLNKIVTSRSQSELPLDLATRAKVQANSSTKVDVDSSPLERRRMALEYVREHGSISLKQYRELTNAAETTAIRDLEALVENGSLRKIGSGPRRRYVQ